MFQVLGATGRRACVKNSRGQSVPLSASVTIVLNIQALSNIHSAGLFFFFVVGFFFWGGGGGGGRGGGYHSVLKVV